MSEGWFVHGPQGQLGPFSLPELNALLETYPDANALRVWRGAAAAGKMTEESLDRSNGALSPPIVASEQPSNPAPEPSDPAVSLPNHRFNNFVAKHWRGEYRLWVAYWIFGSIGNTAALNIPTLVSLVFRITAGYEPNAIFAAMVISWLCVVPISVWELVGVWRSANNTIQRRRLLAKKSFWAWTAKIVVVLAFSGVASQLIFTALPQLREMYHVAFQDDPNIPSYTFRIMRHGTEIELTGGIKYGLTDDFSRFLKASPQIKVVHLDSVGGRIGEALRLSDLIHEKNLTTYVAAKCLSACTLIFAGGKQRYLREGAVLGFHGPAFPGMTPSQLSSAVQVQKVLLRNAGIESAFSDRALGTPSSSMWVPTVDELLRAKVITAISKGAEFSSSGYGKVTRDEMGVRLVKAFPILRLVKERLPKRYENNLDFYYQGYLDGKTEEELLTSSRARLQAMLRYLRQFSDDDVLVAAARLFVEEFSELGAKNPVVCPSGPFGVNARSFSSDVSPRLQKMESDIDERVIKTSRERPPIPPVETEALMKTLREHTNEQGLTPERLSQMRTNSDESSKSGAYCSAGTIYFFEITKFPQKDAAIIMRRIVTMK